MNEDFLHYIWQYKLYNSNNLITQCGQAIEVINSGEHNKNAGPDFFNAKIKIGDTLWAGNVEVHTKASDWIAHKHNNNKAYDNVILHVVEKADTQIRRTNNQTIPVLQISYSSALYTEYLNLKNTKHWLACAPKLSEISPIEIMFWTDRMLIERLETKTEDIARILKQTTNDWDETFYRLLSRSFGFGVNGDPFELLAQSLPLKILLKYSNNTQLVEALLFGQAGFLNQTQPDEYSLALQTDYNFLQHKHKLQPIDLHLWKFLRLRPQNFPTIRIAQLSALIVKLKGMFGALYNKPNIQNIYKILDINVSEYWHTHYTFGKASAQKNKLFGSSSKQLIAINTIVPYIFALGKVNNNQEQKNIAINLLQDIKPEKNELLNKWKEQNISIKNAAISQSLIYLSNNYCKQKKCLRCSIGHKILTINHKE